MTNLNNIEPKTVSMPVPPVTTTPEKDDFGYEVVVDPAAPIVSPVAPIVDPAAPIVPPVAVKSSTGYVIDPTEEVPPAEVIPPVVEKKLEEMNDEEKAQKEIKDVIGALGAGYDKTKIEKFAVDNKLTKDQLSAYVEMTKAEDAQFVKDRAAAQVKYRNDSINELKADPVFGGENFIKNVERVDMLLEKNMPNVKKMLTEKGGVLPTYLMKDLLSLSKVLNPTNTFVGGEPPAPAESNSNFLDDLYK